MKKISTLLIVLLAYCLPTRAQEAHLAFHAGETVHLLVAFEKPPASLDGATFAFSLVGQPERGQEQLDRNIQGNQLTKLSEKLYEISGRIPDHAANGEFRLNWISIGIRGVGKQYTEGQDFKPVSITVISSEHPEFPAISDVKVGPGNSP